MNIQNDKLSNAVARIGALAPLEPVFVSSDRFAPGRWCHLRNKMTQEGDISAAFSADLIASHARVRNPFRLQRWLCITTSVEHGPRSFATAYRMIPADCFKGTTTSYYGKRYPQDGDYRRSERHGFYHSIAVQHGGKSYVLCGPPVDMVAGHPEPTQIELY